MANPATSEEVLGSTSEVEQVKLAEEFWLKENTVEIAGYYVTYNELLVQDRNDPEQKKGTFVRLPWNRQDISHGCVRLVYNNKAFRGSNLGNVELFMLVSQQMFLHGDCHRPCLLSSWVVARCVQEELTTMLTQIVKGRGNTEEELLADPLTPPVTYGELVAWLKQCCPIRLRRLIKYQMAENSRTHKIHLVKPVQPPRNSQDFLMEELMDNTPVDVRIFKDTCPLLYNGMLENLPYPQFNSQTDPVNNLRFYTCKYDRELEHKIDPHLQIAHWGDKTSKEMIRSESIREKLQYVENVSMCSATGRKNVYYACLFHEFLGKPPLQTDIIYILDFLAREIIKDVVHTALDLRRPYAPSTETISIEVPVYLEAITILKTEVGNGMVLSGIPFQFPRADVEELVLPELPDNEVLTKLDKLIRRAKRWDKRKEMTKALDSVTEDENAEPVVHLSGESVKNLLASEVLLNAYRAAMPPKPAPAEEPVVVKKKTKKRKPRQL